MRSRIWGEWGKEPSDSDSSVFSGAPLTRTLTLVHQGSPLTASVNHFFIPNTVRLGARAPVDLGAHNPSVHDTHLPKSTAFLMRQGAAVDVI